MLQAALVVVVLASAPCEVVKTLEGDACAPWAKIDVLVDRETEFDAEGYLEGTAHKAWPQFGGGVVKAFGTPTPDPSWSLLHHAPAPETPSHAVPVLLLHGVGADATLTFFAENIGGETGLAPRLVQEGFRVYAVSFAVSHGDVISHAVHVVHAIARIQAETGCEQVDVVAHSAGGLAARAALVRVARRIPKLKKRAIRRLITIGTPNEGFDLSFRHPRAYTWFGSYGFPSPWIVEGSQDSREASIFGPAYAGHRQMTADLRALHPLGTMEERARETYSGAEWPGTKAPGLRTAERAGRSFMRRLNAKRLPKSVEVYLVAGTDNRLRYYDHSAKIRTQVGEYDGPSDGLVFVASALGERVFKGRRVHERLRVHAPHFELQYTEAVQQAVARWLASE